MTALRDRLAAGDLDALDSFELEMDLLADPPFADPEHWWWQCANRLAIEVLILLYRAGLPNMLGAEVGWIVSRRAMAEEALGDCQRLRALGPVGCERELRALATLERLCGLPP